jgi:hypothetical protein
MTTIRGEISPGTSGHLNDQLTGRIWLTQARGQWPIQLHVSENQVITWLENNPTGAAWEYEVTPVRRVEVVTHEPHLAEFGKIEPIEDEKPPKARLMRNEEAVR